MEYLQELVRRSRTVADYVQPASEHPQTLAMVMHAQGVELDALATIARLIAAQRATIDAICAADPD